MPQFLVKSASVHKSFISFLSYNWYLYIKFSVRVNKPNQAEMRIAFKMSAGSQWLPLYATRWCLSEVTLLAARFFWYIVNYVNLPSKDIYRNRWIEFWKSESQPVVWLAGPKHGYTVLFSHIVIILVDWLKYQYTYNLLLQKSNFQSLLISKYIRHFQHFIVEKHCWSVSTVRGFSVCAEVIFHSLYVKSKC